MQNKILYLHLRNPRDLNKGGATVAFKPTEDGYIEFALALCSVKDNFCRRTGRLIASNRLQKRITKHQHTLLEVFPSSNIKEFIAHCYDTWNMSH